MDRSDNPYMSEPESEDASDVENVDHITSDWSGKLAVAQFAAVLLLIRSEVVHHRHQQLYTANIEVG